MGHKHNWVDSLEFVPSSEFGHCVYSWRTVCEQCRIHRKDAYGMYVGDYSHDLGYGNETPPYEPTAYADFVAEKMREVYEAFKPRGFFARRHDERMLSMGCADGLMIQLQNVVAYWESRRPK